MTRERSRREAAYSLIELMLSAAVLAGVMVLVTQALTRQQQTYIVVDQVAEAQQSLRAASDLIEHDVRRAGYLVPTHARVCGWDAQTGPDTLFLSDAEAIRPIDELEADEIDFSNDLGAPVSGVSSSTNVGADDDYALLLDQLWLDTDDDGDDFAVGSGVIVVNQVETSQPVACGRITAISGNTLTVDFGSTSTGAVGSNANVLAVPAVVYRLDGAKLYRNADLLASGVEDFQITYFVDEDSDHVVDSGEMWGTQADASDANPFGRSPESSRPDFSRLLEVGVNLVTLTRQDDPNSEYTLGAGAITGNRTTGLPTGDGKRRRVNSARVRLRNGGVQ